ncbi:MAG TPA: hypothetical protein DCL21_05000 [Alphaproteobacteria bacterium]|nr:hypothetical protein [Alphaproteobacteria bacterium]
MGCLFCKIVDKKVKAEIVYENAKTICFIPTDMEVKGHLLVTPKAHYETMFDMPEEELSELIATAKKVSVMLKEKLNAEGVNILHASGKAAQQGLDHFHMHILPRYADDNLDVWPDLPYLKFNKEEILEKLKS